MYNVDLVQYQKKAHQLMTAFKEGAETFKAAAAMLTPEEHAGIYHYLHDEGGLGKLETGFLDQIRSGALGLRNPEYIRAAIALRVLMDDKPGSHQERIGMVDSPHEPVDPEKYKGGSQMIDKYMDQGHGGMRESKINKSYIMQVIKEEVKATLG